MRQPRKKLRDGELGFYAPSTFYMHVDVDNEGKDALDLNALTATQRSTFFHEYIHFIQDISTFSGLNDNYVRGEYLACAINEIYNNPKLKLPIASPTGNLIAVNEEYNDIVSGDVDLDDDDSTVNDINVVIKKQQEAMAPDVDLPVVMLDTIDARGEHHDYEFGYIAIMESMAFLVEQYVYPNDLEDSPVYPYHLASIIADKKHPDFGKNKLNLIALCDICLLSGLPGYNFLNYLETFKQLGLNTPHAVYDWFYTYHPECISGTFNAYRSLMYDVERKSHEHFQTDGRNEEYNKVNKWIEITFGKARHFRENDRYYLIDCIEKGETGLNQIYEDFGTPLIMDSRHYFYLYNKEIAELPLGHFMAIEQLYMVLIGEQTECTPSIDLCSKSNIPTDKRCMNEPWKHCNDKDLCPFGAQWKSKKLSSFNP